MAEEIDTPIPPIQQDESERRQIRLEYRQIQDELADQVQDLVKPADTDDKLYEKLQSVESLSKKVQHAREAAYDSASLVNISELGKKKAQALKTDFLRFNPADFCDKVKLRLQTAGHQTESSGGLSHENWVTLGKGTRPFYKVTPTLKLCGAPERSEVVVKSKKVAEEKLQDTGSNKKTEPTQLSSFENTDRGELTTAQVEHLISTLWTVYEANQNNPICYFEFITHPTSFGHTVENMFYASFLIKDGLARIFLDSDELPVIEPVQRTLTEAASDAQNVRNKQVIMSITPPEWREIVKVFGIETPIIKPLKQQAPASQQQHAAPLKDSRNTNQSEAIYDGKGKGKGKQSKK